MANITSYKDSKVWQYAIQLAIDMYNVTSQMPAVERLGLSTQLQQTAVAIPTKIASGSRSGSKAGFKQACSEALVSLAEMDTLLAIAGQQYPTVDIQSLLSQHDELEQLLRTLIHRLSSPSTPKTV